MFSLTLARHTLVALTAALAVAACSDDPDPSSPEGLFGALPAPTINKLRGVFMNTVEDASSTVEIRLRFTNGSIAGAGRCTYKSGTSGAAPHAPILVGGSLDVPALDDPTLDAAAGKFTMGDLSFQKTEGTTICQAGLRGASYDFKVEEDLLTLSIPNSTLTLPFKKIGD